MITHMWLQLYSMKLWTLVPRTLACMPLYFTITHPANSVIPRPKHHDRLVSGRRNWQVMKQFAANKGKRKSPEAFLYGARNCDRKREISSIAPSRGPVPDSMYLPAPLSQRLRMKDCWQPFLVPRSGGEWLPRIAGWIWGGGLKLCYYYFVQSRFSAEIIGQ
jgi:hypothetical protein